MDRVILHCDMNSFFASVELLDHPELKDVPVAVSGDADTRHGIIPRHVIHSVVSKFCDVGDMAIDADDFRLRGRLSLAMQHRHHGVRIADGVTVLIGARNALLLSEILNVRSFDMAPRRAE